MSLIDNIRNNSPIIKNSGLIQKAFGVGLEKAKDVSKLTKKVITVTRGGRTFQQTVYVKEGEEIETPVGEELSPEVNGMNIKKYSEKALLITGDTYVNIDTLRDIKKEIGVGSWNANLKGWIFPIAYLETILGHIWSKLKDKGEDEKAQAVQNQKNAGLKVGDKADIHGIEGEVKENVSDSEGTKYNVKLNDGTKLEGVDEKVMGKKPETDDKKISEAINNTTPESRVKTEKQIYGIKPIENIHQYSLQEYMKMHGLSQEDIDKVVDAFKNPKTKEEVGKRASTGGVKKEYTDKTQIEGLTKRQLIGKLVYKHYQSVKSAIEAGEEIKPESLELYSDLKENYSKKRQAMSEETKRKISEALKKNKVEKENYPKKMKFFFNKDSVLTHISTDTMDYSVNSKEGKRLRSLITDPLTHNSPKDLRYIKTKNSVSMMSEFILKPEFLDSNKPEEKTPEQSVKDVKQIDKENYKPKEGESFSITSPSNTVQREPVVLKTKDYTDIPALDIVIPKQKDILNKPKPYFIPEIDQKKFANNSYTIPAVKVGEDKYLVALDGFRDRNSYMFSLEVVNKEGRFAVMSLDAYVATQNYYQLKAKQELKEYNIKRNENFIQSLRDKLEQAKVEGNKERVDILQKQFDYYKDRKPRVSRLSILASNKMTYDQMYMIQAFNRDENNNFIGTRDVWKIYGEFAISRDQKSSDLELNQEYLDSTYTKGAKTSYGDSGTKDDLLKDYGVKVKRQNGDEINKDEISQIKGALDSVGKVFGNNIQMNKEFGLKISHSGNVMMHARKVIGLFHPFYNAIGVSAGSGDKQFNITFAHEYGHFMDYWIGKQTGNHYASDKQGTIANEIADTLRKNMNKKTDSKYTNRTCECFARSMEQYYQAEVLKDEGTFLDEDHTNKETYETKLKPLIKQFLEENKELLKSFINIFVK